MRLGLGMSPHLALALVCTVCQRAIDFDQQAEDITSAALFGSTRYGFCPGCLQEAMPSTQADPGYQRRARVKLFERFGRVIREAPGAAHGSILST